MKNLLKTALLKTLPVMAGYIVLGFGFGIISLKNGYGFWWVLAMSALIYAGSMQYVTVSLLTSGASLLTTALTTLMVNARHLFYGISMIEPYEDAGKKKPYMIFALTDETYSLVCTGEAPDGLDKHQYFFTVSLLNQLYWVFGSVLGVLVGTTVSFDSTGIDFAMTALFITVFVEQWKSTGNHIPAMVGLLVSVCCLALFGPGSFLIPSMVGISVLLFLGKSHIEQKGEL